MHKIFYLNSLLKLERKYKHALFKPISKNSSFDIEKNSKPESIKSEKYIYVITDRYSVKPDYEIKLTKIKTGNEHINKNSLIHSQDAHSYNYKCQINNYNRISYLSPKDISQISKIFTKRVFFPRDYPQSVRSGYFDFMKFSFLAGICFHTMTFISTQVLINTLGITSSQNQSLTLSAGLNWVIKDSVGQIGSIIFSAKYSNSIEMNIKQWRLISLYIYDLGILLEISTMLYPNYFLLIASVSTICTIYLFNNKLFSKSMCIPWLFLN